MEGKPVTFTATEIEGLEQIVSAGHKWLDGSNPAYPDLILKIGSAFLEAQDGAKSQELYLNDVQAWYLREIVPAGLRVRGETVGLVIKRKLYPLLLQFEADRYSGPAVQRYGFTPIEEPLSRNDALADQSLRDESSNLEEPEVVADLAEEPAGDGAASDGTSTEVDVADVADVEGTVDSAEVNRDQSGC